MQEAAVATGMCARAPKAAALITNAATVDTAQSRTLDGAASGVRWRWALAWLASVLVDAGCGATAAGRSDDAGPGSV